MKKSTLLFTLLIMGAAFLLVGIYEFSNGLDLAKNGIKAQGTVVDLKEHHSKKKVLYQPEIEFTTKVGQNVRFVYPESSTHSSYSMGQKVHIIYSKDDPKNAVLDSTFSIFGITLIFTFVGIVILLLFLYGGGKPLFSQIRQI